MPSHSPRILVIGLAEATLDLILPWAESGLLPTFDRLRREGTFGTMRSDFPMITPQMWSTIFTGVNPGRHGIYDFWQRGHNGAFREVKGSHLKSRSIWQILSENKISCGIVNLPFTYPPENINGFMISGQDAPGAHPSIARPREIYHEITRKFGRYHLKDIFPGGRKKSDYLTLIPEEVQRQTDILEYLLTGQTWDFFFTFHSATAMAQHYFWEDMTSQGNGNAFKNVVLEAYQSIDASLARAMKAAGDDTNVFVISECGAGPLISGVQLNTLLEKEGFLKRKKGKKKSDDSNSSSRSLIARFRKAIQGKLPKNSFFWVNRYLSAWKSWVQSYLSSSDIDWEYTQVFSRGKEGELYINLKGRDPHGIVSPGKDYDALCEKIKERLMSLIDPKTGLNAVERVVRREELYQGPYLEWAPDLMIFWRNGAYMPTENDKEKDSVFVTRWREYMDWPTSGSHRPDGFLFAHGPSIKPGSRIEGTRTWDLLPTWLHLLNQEISDDFEGKILFDLLVSTERSGT
jgi:predicted AlkP superfamily phosphohydrolase/phosphomutase